MNRDEIERALNAYADAKNRHDLNAAVAAFTDDGYYESKCFGGRVQGREALRKFYGDLFASLPDYFGSFDGVAYGDDSAVVWGRFGGTLSDTFMGMPVERGRMLDIPVTFVCTFRDGKLVGDVGYFDAQTLLTQAGLGSMASRSSDADAVADFVARFKSFWAKPSGARSREVVHAHAKVYWPGLQMSGDELVDHFDRTLRALPGLTLEVCDHADAGNCVFIRWRAHVPTANGAHSWSGVDYFVLEDGKAIEEHVVFDMAGVQDALRAEAAAA